ncbi:peptide chain release factor N(5)-glutamine methyltransferase [Colwelliaceae bacterium BS250]
MSKHLSDSHTTDIVSTSDLNTIEQLFQYGISCFCCFEDAYDAKVDAKVLLSTAINKSSSYLSTWPEKLISADQKNLFLSFVQRRIDGEPVAFIVGKQEFWSLEFLVAPCTLIPRPDTETLVEAVLNNNAVSVLSLLDLGTGTGAIALALASEQRNWQIDAIDFNEQAVSLAKNNVQHLKEHLNTPNINVYQSDWFSNVGQQKKFDVIVSNPPYIDPTDELLKQGDVRFEPLSALISDDNGYADIKRIIEQSRDHLNVNGQLYLEHGFEQHQGVQTLLKHFNFEQITTFNDYGGNPRITMGVCT